MIDLTFLTHLITGSRLNYNSDFVDPELREAQVCCPRSSVNFNSESVTVETYSADLSIYFLSNDVAVRVNSSAEASPNTLFTVQFQCKDRSNSPDFLSAPLIP